MTTTIKCTKSGFRAAMMREYPQAMNLHEVLDVIDGLARAADAHRGVFTGHSAYLDLDFTVSPDEDPRNPATVHYEGVDGETMCGMIPRDLDGTHHRAISYDDGDSTCTACIVHVQQTIDDAAITIPAVTDVQREGAYYSARRTVDQVSDRLARMMSASAPSSELNADRLEDLGAMLYAAAGHLRIANS